MSTPKKKIFLENKRSYSIRSKDSNCISNNKKPSKPIISKGPWKSPENQLLIDWINKNGPRNWTKCAEIIKGRTGKQCREHWNNSLNSEIKKGDWSAEEDLLIMVFHQKFNGSWKKMIPLFKSRTENSIKNRFFSQLRKIASKYIKKGKRVYSTKFGLEILLNYYELGLEQAKKHFLNKSKMSEKELEGYIKSIENKLKKNTKKGEKFIDLSSLRVNKNKPDNEIKLNESEDELTDKLNNIKNKGTARKKNKYKKIKKENSSEKEINGIDISIKIDKPEEPQIQNVEKENAKEKDKNIVYDFNKNSNNINNINNNNIKNNINNIGIFNTLNPNNNNNNNLNYGMTKIPVNNNNIYNKNYNNAYNTNLTNSSTNNIDYNTINKNGNINANNITSNYTLNNIKNDNIISNNNDKYYFKIDIPNNIIKKKSSDLSEAIKNNDFGIGNTETIPKQAPTYMDVFNKLNSYNSFTFNDNRNSGNIDQNNYMNFYPFQGFRNSNIYDDKKSFQFAPTPIADKKFSFPNFRTSESFDNFKGANLLESQFSQGGIKKCASFTSL